MPRDHWSQEAEKRTVDLTLKDSTLLWETVVLLCKCRTPTGKVGPGSEFPPGLLSIEGQADTKAFWPHITVRKPLSFTLSGLCTA